MSKNDPTGKQHYDVTKTSSQPGAKSSLKHEMSEAMPSGSYAPQTPSGMLSGLRGVLSDHAANQSDSKSIGKGGYGKKVQSEQESVEATRNYPYPTGPDTTVSSDSDNENYGSQSSNNIKHGKGPKQPSTHKYE
jgi:hypothetical protein